MRPITLVQLAIGPVYREIVAPALAVNRRYCVTRGYQYDLVEEIPGQTRHPSWEKLPAILARLDGWVVCLDADAVIMRDDIGLERLFLADLTTAIDDADWYSNCGMLAVKHSDWARAFLRRVWDDPDWRAFKTMEQESFNKQAQLVTRREYGERIAKVSRRLVAGHNYYCEGDFIVHFCGNGAEDLSRCIRQYAPLSRQLHVPSPFPADDVHTPS